MKKINEYTIQEWLFNYAEGKFDIDLAESGIQFHHINDLKIQNNYDLNYSLDRGKKHLRETIAHMYGKSSDQVAITHGAQEGLYLFYQSFIQNGDHVITFTPGWQQSWEVPKLAGAEVSCLTMDKKNNYQIDIARLKAAIKINTRLLILNYPNNPLGTMISESDMNQIIDLCADHNIFIMADEEYFIDYPKSIVNRYKNSAAVSSLSKVYGFPGLRTGWFVSSKEIVDQVVNYKRYVTVSNSSLCEYLAAEVLQNYKKYLAEYRDIVGNGYLHLVNWTTQHPCLKLIEPQGTPFAYLTLDTELSSYDFSLKLLKEQKVLVMPAEVFEDTQAIRISFGRSEKILNEGFARITQTLTQCVLTHA